MGHMKCSNIIINFCQVSEMLESGKSLFTKLNQDFEERVLMYESFTRWIFYYTHLGRLFNFPSLSVVCYRIHKEQIEKWQEEIKELRMIDTTNEEMHARLNNVKCLLQTVHIGQWKFSCGLVSKPWSIVLSTVSHRFAWKTTKAVEKCIKPSKFGMILLVVYSIWYASLNENLSKKVH